MAVGQYIESFVLAGFAGTGCITSQCFWAAPKMLLDDHVFTGSDYPIDVDIRLLSTGLSPALSLKVLDRAVTIAARAGRCVRNALAILYSAVACKVGGALLRVGLIAPRGQDWRVTDAGIGIETEEGPARGPSGAVRCPIQHGRDESPGPL